MTLNMTFRFQTECKFLFCSRFVLALFFLPPSLSHSFACIYSVYALFYMLTQRATLRPVLMKRFFFSCSPCYSYISEFPFNLVWTHLKLGSIFRSHFLPSLVRFPTFHYLNRHSAVHMPMTKKKCQDFPDLIYFTEFPDIMRIFKGGWRCICDAKRNNSCDFTLKYCFAAFSIKFYRGSSVCTSICISFVWKPLFYHIRKLEILKYSALFAEMRKF